MAHQHEKIYLRIRRELLQTSSRDLPTESPLTKHIYLIEGTKEDIRVFAGNTMAWILKIARLICSPSQPLAAQVYTHTTGTAPDWYSKEKEDDWRQILSGEALAAGVYEVDVDAPVLLSQLSQRPLHSLTSKSRISSSKTLRSKLEQRDRICVATHLPEFVTSHLIPKRMGMDGTKLVVQNFVREAAPDANVDQFHPTTTILLFPTIDKRVDHYMLGFYHEAGATYTLHNFQGDLGVSLLGVDSLCDAGEDEVYLPTNSFPRLHRHKVTLRVRGGTDSLPPQGVFDWHYLQCVAQKFAADDYRNFPNVNFDVHPFKTEDDDDLDEYEDNDEAEPPCPTHRFDQAMAKRGRSWMLKERAKEIAAWSDEVE